MKGDRWLDGGRRRRACRRCGGPHRVQDCGQSLGTLASQASDAAASRGRGACFKCGKWDHWARDCHLNREIGTQNKSTDGIIIDKNIVGERPLNTRQRDDGAGISNRLIDGSERSALRRRLHEPDRTAASLAGTDLKMASTLSPPVSLPAPVELSAEQRTVLERVSTGSSVFFTGCAGTGKSLLLCQIIAMLRVQHPGEGEVAVCASTGIAAVHLGGVTLHSWAGVGLGEGEADALVVKVTRSRRATSKWLCAKVIVVDEISMLDGCLLDALELIARRVRRKEVPFGGLQLVLCGDFFQLPPVGLERGAATWCFDARCWGSLVTPANCFVLRHVFRQREAVFVKLLDEVRHGSTAMSPKTCEMLRATEQHSFGADIEPTKLFSHNADVDRINSARLAELRDPVTSFTAKDSGKQPYLGQLQNHCIAPAELNLKVGAQVMLLKNVDPAAGLVNGTRGVVQAFERSSGGTLLPVVRMHVPDNAALGSSHGGVVTRRIAPDEWTIELSGSVVARRLQIPLRLAWAISIHKSQGMTIDALEADLGRIFEYGQAYVALSRATNLARLRALNFDASRVKTHPRVVEFSRALEAQFCDGSLKAGQDESMSARSDLPQLQTKLAVHVPEHSAEGSQKQLDDKRDGSTAIVTVSDDESAQHAIAGGA